MTRRGRYIPETSKSLLFVKLGVSVEITPEFYFAFLTF
jgi:hypothetical protein